jgi:hypothetical protein
MSNPESTKVNLVFVLVVAAAAFFGYKSMIQTEALDSTQRQLEIEKTKVEQINQAIDKLRNF